MGSEDRRLLLREIAEMLAYARTDGYGTREIQEAIYKGVADNLEQINDDIEDSAGNLEDSFPDRADQLREDWQWVEEAQSSVETIQGDLEDPDWDEDPVAIADDLEMEFERQETPRKRPPPLEELVDLTPQAPEAKKTGARQEHPGFLDVITKPYTWRTLMNAHTGGRLTVEEARASLRYFFQLLNNASMEEFNRFFEHETTQEDLDKLVRNQAATREEIKPWREALEMQDILRSRGKSP